MIDKVVVSRSHTNFVKKFNRHDYKVMDIDGLNS